MTNSNCYGCYTYEDLIWIWSNSGRSIPVCKTCYETNPLYIGKEKLDKK